MKFIDDIITQHIIISTYKNQYFIKAKQAEVLHFNINLIGRRIIKGRKRKIRQIKFIY